MQHREQKYADKCCKDGCDDFCGGENKAKCENKNGCCGSSIHNKCSENQQAPCVLPRKNSYYFLYF